MSHTLLALVMAAIAGGAAGYFIASRRGTRDCVDIPSIRWLEIVVSDDRRNVWVNGPNGLLLRAYRIEQLSNEGQYEQLHRCAGC
ncbi:MAG TPA: hypothetical protein VIY51_15535 [Xanthobacteraceae bacterium]